MTLQKKTNILMHHRKTLILILIAICIGFNLTWIKNHIMPENPYASLPRNMALNAFDPYRPAFECKIEAAVVPPIDEEAQAWFDEALYITRVDLYAQDLEDYPKAIALYEKAAAKHHWKAMLNLASIYLNGAKGIDPDTEKGVLLVEEAMKLGIPSAFDLMGTLHQHGQGVNQNTDRAFAFWQLAADMGSASAQAFLGRSYMTVPGGETPEVTWANPKVGLQMMKCAAAQGNVKASNEAASYESSGTLMSVINMNANPMNADRIYQNGVKNGCDNCGSLGKDEHSRRYMMFAGIFTYHPEYRFPNLDKVLPLPPTPLPVFTKDPERCERVANGMKEGDCQMVMLAKGVQYPVITKVDANGKLTTTTHPRVSYGLDREIPYADTAPPALASPNQPPFAAPNAPKLRYLTSGGEQPSPHAGIWRVSVAPTHPLAHMLNRSWSAPNQGQVHVQKGQHFPNPQTDWMLTSVKPEELTWWLLEAD